MWLVELHFASKSGVTLIFSVEHLPEVSNHLSLRMRPAPRPALPGVASQRLPAAARPPDAPAKGSQTGHDWTSAFMFGMEENERSNLVEEAHERRMC